jgi:transposase
MAKRYIIDLTDDEKERLIELISKGRPGARKIKRANMLLLADAGKTDREIGMILQTSVPTVLRTRQKFVNGGPELALNERSRAGRFPKINDKVETILTTIAQSQPPKGRKRWTVQLITDRLVALTHLESLSDETVRLVLKKTVSNLGSAKNGAFRRSSALSLSGGWKICWICMPNLINLPIQWSVLMKFLTNWSAKRGNPCPFSREKPSDMTMNTSGRAPAICSCFWSLGPVGGM